MIRARRVPPRRRGRGKFFRRICRRAARILGGRDRRGLPPGRGFHDRADLARRGGFDLSQDFRRGKHRRKCRQRKFAGSFLQRQTADAHGVFTLRANQFDIFGANEQFVRADHQAKGQSRPAIENSAADEIHINEPQHPRHRQLRRQAIFDIAAARNAVVPEIFPSRPTLPLPENLPHLSVE